MKEKLGVLKNKWLFVILAAIIAIIAGVLFYANNRISISFSDEMPQTAPVNQVLDITQYINNPNDEILVLSAEYVQDGVSGQYAVAGLSFKPKYTGEVKLTVTISGTKKYIETTIEIVEAAPVFVSAEEANYYVGQTIQLEELMDYIVYDSKSTPELIVNKVEYGANKIDMTGVKEFTFEEIASYIFYVDIKNSGGSASGMVTARVTKELTPNEENDLTNTIRLISDTHAAIEISEDDHSENSDWAWEITANAADVYEEGNRNFFLNVVYIDFEKEIDTAKEYFTMDVKVSEDANGFRFNLMDSAGDLHEIAKDYNDIKGEWFSVSSEDLYDVGYYTGIFITIMHPRGEDKVGTYNVTNVKALVDNCFLQDRGDVKPITNKVVTSGSSAGVANLTSPIAGNIQYASHLHMQGNYTEECFEFTTTIQDKWNPNLVIGARLDNVTKNVQESTGIILKFNANEQANHQYVAIYSPTYHGANHVQSAAGYKFEDGQQYTFIVKVTNAGNGKSTISLRIMTADNETILMFTSDEISGVPTKGSFAVWNLDKERRVSYKMPYAEKQNVNKIVASNGSDGTATIKSAYPGTFTTNGMDASFLQMKGSYGEECFEFTTKITQQNENVPNLLIGARLNQVSSSMYDSEGIIICVFNDRVAYYAPYYHGQTHKGSFGFSGFTLENGKEYTFIVQVSTETDGTEILNLTIKEGDKVLGIYSHTSNLESKGEMNVANSGSFAVWNLDATRKITYKMPYKVPVNTNVVVSAKGSAGKANLKSVYEGMHEDTSYLHMQGNYTEECFEFTTTIQDKWNPNLVIGARLDNVTKNVQESTGIILKFNANEQANHQYVAIYSPTYHGANHVQSAAGYKFEDGQQYTFIVKVTNAGNGKSTISLRIMTADNETILMFTSDEISGVPTKGSFAVWNLDKERRVSYKMPYAEKQNVNKIVASNGSDGTATIKSAYPGTFTTNGMDASFLQMKGSYGEECFEFTTKITQQNENVPNLLIGARLNQVSSSMYDSEGIIICVFNDRVAYYAPYYHGQTHKGSFGFSGFTLENGKEYTFIVQVSTETDGTEILNLTIKEGDKVLGIYSHTTNLEAKGAIDVAASGSFAVWNLDATREIAYKMPYKEKQNVNKIVTSNGSDGTATLTTGNPGVMTSSGTNASYLEMKGNYTEEIFEFTTKITEAASSELPNLLIGARLDQVTANMYESNGIVIAIFNNRLAYYAPNYQGTNHKGSFGFSGFELENGKEYTFVVQVETQDDDTDILNITIKDGTTVLGIYSHTTNLEAKGAIDVAASGSFAVWNLDATRKIAYKMPYEEKQNVNKIVTGTEGDGTATLTTVNPGIMTSSGTDASYLEMQGNYTEEKFAFTTKITEAASADIPNLLIGARLDQVTANMYESNGIVIAIFNNRLAYYAPSYQGANHKGSFGFSGFTLENGKEYTFVVQVETQDDDTDILNLTIKDGTTVLGTYSHTTNLAAKGAIDVAESGSFAVWNLDATREIAYKQPRAAYSSYSVQGIVNGEDTTYSDAKTELRFTLDALPDVAQNVEFTKTEESRVLYNGVEVSDYYFSRVGDDFVLGMKSLYNTDASAKDAPDTGDIIAVSGVFETLENGVKGFELLSYEFTYVGDSWTWSTHEVSTITNGNINITSGLQDEFLFKFSVNPNTPRDLNLASDGNHQVIYNGTELGKTEYGFYKVNEDGRYVLGVANALTAPIKGDTLVIKGVFEAVKDNVTYGLVVKEQTFYFDGANWTMEYVEADPVTPDDGNEEESDNVLVTITEVRIAGNTDAMGFEAKSASEYYLWLNVDATTLNSDLGYSSGAYSDYFKVVLNGNEINCRIRVFSTNIALVLPATTFSELVNVAGTNITIPKGTIVTSTAADTKVLEFTETFTYCNQDGTTWAIVPSVPIKITGVRELNVDSKYLRFNLNITSLPTDVNVFFLKAPIYINGVKQELVVRTIKHGSIFQVILDANALPTLTAGLTVYVPEGTVFIPSGSDGYKTGYPQSYILEEGFTATYNGSQWVSD